MKELPIILKKILNNKVVWFLTMLQVALTLAVLVNSYASIDGFNNTISDDMGIAQDRLIALELEILEKPETTNRLENESFYKNQILQLRNKISSVPGINQLSITDGLPVSDSAYTRRVKLKHNDELSTGITIYKADENFLSTLESPIVIGSSFKQSNFSWTSNINDFADTAPFIIISQALSDKIFPDGNSLNQQISMEDKYFTVVGVVDRLPGLHPLWTNVEMSAYVPGKVAAPKVKILISVDQLTDLNKVIANVEDVFIQNSGKYYYKLLTMDELKATTLSQASSTLKILGSITVLLLIVSAFGIYGQTAFNVSKKAKETGIKRALGATKTDILTYYLIENWMVTTIGIAFGLVLASLLNYMLIQGLGATKIDFTFIVPSILFLWLIGFVATLLPALKAAKIPPVHATRTI